jgi:uncharacterized protein (DUF342 family)
LINAFLVESDIGKKIEVANGKPSAETRDEIVEFRFDTNVSSNPASRRDEEPVAVRKGDCLARITPCKPGDPGKNVLGNVIRPSEPKIIHITGGKGVIRKDLEFFAEMDGIPILFKNRTLFVTQASKDHPIEHFTGNIDTDMMDKYGDSFLKLEGDILETGVVNCHRLTLSGNVFGSVSTTGDIDIKGGISKKNEPRINPISLRANESIFVKKDICHADIVTSDSLIAPRSDAIASHICARRDIILKNVHTNSIHPDHN